MQKVKFVGGLWLEKLYLVCFYSNQNWMSKNWNLNFVLSFQ